jgi:hypothetical protein
MTFDPFSATKEEALAQPNSMAIPNGSFRQWETAQLLSAQRNNLSKDPLGGLALCFNACIAPPNWLTYAFLDRYNKTKSGFFRTWDDAFGDAQPKGYQLKTTKLGSNALLSFPPVRNGLLIQMFSDPKGLPKTRAGRQEAAKRLGITESEVRNLLSQLLPIRRHKTLKYAARQIDLVSPGTAHNPFGTSLQKDNEL